MYKPLNVEPLEVRSITVWVSDQDIDGDTGKLWQEQMYFRMKSNFREQVDKLYGAINCSVAYTGIEWLSDYFEVYEGDRYKFLKGYGKYHGICHVEPNVVNMLESERFRSHNPELVPIYEKAIVLMEKGVSTILVV